jgi:hypothetical protein
MIIIKEAFITAMTRRMSFIENPTATIAQTVLDFINVPANIKKIILSRRYRDRAADLINSTEIAIEKKAKEIDDADEFLLYIQYEARKFRDKLDVLYKEYETKYRKAGSLW